MAKPSITLTFREGVGIEQIHQAVEQFVAAYGSFRPDGCRTCGLGGIDFYLTAEVDPAPYLAVQSDDLRQSSHVLQASLNPQPLPP